NVSETVIKVIYESCDKFSKENQIWLKEGILKRLGIIKKLLGNKIDDTFVDIDFNVDRPINETELVDNILKCIPSGTQLMSEQTAMGKLPFLGVDIQSERDRIHKEIANKTKIVVNTIT
ncbi:MAG: phage portal protein, partial [Ruminiclostridium sp.]